jgi:hypothetical protein
MRHTNVVSAELGAALDKIGQQQLAELALDDLAHLVVEPDAPPFAPRRGPHRAGVDDLALTLTAMERLPDQLTVRVVLPPGTRQSVATDVARTAMNSRAADLASESWREAMAVRSMGRRQLPLGVGLGIGAAVVAYAAAYLAAVVDTAAARGALIVVAMIALTVAWVIGWVVVEAAILDWRLPARRAAACELLSKATLEIVCDAGSEPSTRPEERSPGA